MQERLEPLLLALKKGGEHKPKNGDILWKLEKARKYILS